MISNKLIIDSGFGSYLKGEKPKAIANEFLYYNPSLLLLIDEMYCDVNAMKEEEIWADKGFMVSELSLQLEKNNVIKKSDFSTFFDNNTSNYLIEESNEDVLHSSKHNLLPYAMPEVDSAKKNRNRFYDINTLLFLSSSLDLPYLNTNPTTTYFDWKFKKWQQGITQDFGKKQLIASHLIEIYAPNLTIFPTTKLFAKAEKSKSKLFEATKAQESGQISLKALQKVYDAYLNSWLKYDQSVKNEALDKFQMIMEFRNDKRIQKFRKFINDLTERLPLTEEDSDLVVSLKIQKELLEIEYEIADENKEYEQLDKYSKYVSFPTQAITTIGSATAAYFTNNPFFIALGLYPSFLDFTFQTAKDLHNKKYLWKSYLHDIKERAERVDRLRTIESQLENLTKIK